MLDNLQEGEENIESDLIDKHVEGELTRINLFIRGIFGLDYSDLLDLLNRERQKNGNKTLH